MSLINLNLQHINVTRANHSSLAASLIMPFADALASSDGPEQETLITGESNLDGADPDGFDSSSAPTRSHSRQSSLTRSVFSPSPSLSGISSVLGRRTRELGPQAWSPREKVQIREFAADKCAEYELSASERKNIMKDSEVCRFLRLVLQFTFQNIAINARALGRFHVQISPEQVGHPRRHTQHIFEVGKLQGSSHSSLLVGD